MTRDLSENKVPAAQGFAATDGEQTSSGIRFASMEYEEGKP